MKDIFRRIFTNKFRGSLFSEALYQWESLPDFSYLGDQKNHPDGAKHLQLVTAKTPYGVNYSDGSKWIDYDKLPEGSLEKTVFDKGIKSKNFALVTKYKPDGSSFRAITPAKTSAPFIPCVPSPKA